MERVFDIQTIKQRFGIIGNSPALNHAIEVAMQVAPTDMTVLILGESGVGKESFSKIIHALSTRKHGQFIAINCGAIPSGTIDSELFGHEKGSFTGAHSDRKGYFEVVDGGTIFLDEIGEMPLETQSRLLRILENGEFIKVGASKVQKTDVRVVAATNKNLLIEVQKGKFREDLYYRLCTVPIEIPPVRERGSDIYLLFRKFSADHSEKYKVKPITLTDDAVQLLSRYRFPGNIRQLKNISEQISVLETEREVNAETLKKYLPSEPNQNMPILFGNASTNDSSMSERDILYKFLFEMKHDLNELKKIVYESISGDYSPEQITQKYHTVFDDIEETAPVITSEKPLKKVDSDIYINPPKEEKEAFDEYEEASDFDHHEIVDDNLSIDDMEKNLILKALEKHKNRRKRAAQDLGISERTLYRKLKQYDIE
jgi:transcriptional regulator with PAS, ATPase and Fis domain